MELRKLTDPCIPNDSLITNSPLYKRNYIKSFERLGETERYYWYTPELKKKLSVSFNVTVKCKICDKYFDFNIWKHYPLISKDTDLKTAEIYEIGVDTEQEHDFPEEFMYKLLDRKQALFKFFDVLFQKYRIISVEDCL